MNVWIAAAQTASLRWAGGWPSQSWAALAWAALGGAIWLLPGRVPRGAGSGAGVDSSESGSSGLSLPVLRLLAVCGSAAACIGMLGVLRGVALGALCAPLVAWLVGRLDARAGPRRVDPRLPFCLDLVAACLRAGQPLSTALVLAAPAALASTAHSLERVAGLLRLGAEPAHAWRIVADDPGLSSLALLACRSAHSGVRLAGALDALADDLRAEHAALALARAHRAGVAAMAPLGACFLPAFVCLGIVPVVLGVARGALGAVP